LMRRLSAAGILPGKQITVAVTSTGVEVGSDSGNSAFEREVSDHVFVRAS
jgi:Fe2+ transport system protein FeoA